MIPEWLKAYEGYLDIWIEEDDSDNFDYHALDMTRTEVVRLFYLLFESLEFNEEWEEELRERFHRFEVMWNIHDTKDVSSGQKKRGKGKWKNVWEEDRKLLTDFNWECAMSYDRPHLKIADQMYKIYKDIKRPTAEQIPREYILEYVKEELSSKH